MIIKNQGFTGQNLTKIRIGVERDDETLLGQLYPYNAMTMRTSATTEVMYSQRLNDELDVTAF